MVLINTQKSKNRPVLGRSAGGGPADISHRAVVIARCCRPRWNLHLGHGSSTSVVMSRGKKIQEHKSRQWRILGRAAENRAADISHRAVFVIVPVVQDGTPHTEHGRAASTLISALVASYMHALLVAVMVRSRCLRCFTCKITGQSGSGWILCFGEMPRTTATIAVRFCHQCLWFRSLHGFCPHIPLPDVAINAKTWIPMQLPLIA